MVAVSEWESQEDKKMLSGGNQSMIECQYPSTRTLDLHRLPCLYGLRQLCFACVSQRLILGIQCVEVLVKLLEVGSGRWSGRGDAAFDKD